MKYLMGIDNGGTFAKAALFTEDGRQVSVASVSIETVAPQPGYAERDMNALWKNNAEAIRRCIEKSGVSPREIAGVSFSGHGKGLYLVGEGGTQAYKGILSTDTRAWEYPKKWKEDGTMDKIRPLSYQTILPYQPVSLLAWLRDHEPEVIERTKYIFHAKDYIRYKLTGEAYAEYTDSTGGNLVNLNTKRYDAKLLECFGLSEIMDKLPPLKYSNEVCGYVTEEASKETGLPQGIPAAAGMFDVDACGLASGLISEKELCMIAGTWSINEFIAPAPICNNSVALNSMYCMPGYFLVEESSPTSAGNLEWFIRNLMKKEQEEAKQAGSSIYQLTNRLVEEVEPQDSKLLFLPFLNGSGENALATGTFIGLTGYHTRAHMLRAVYEGVVFSHYYHVQKLLQNRNQPESIRLSGGAANSDVWVQIFADTLQLPIDVIEDKENGAQGAAMVAGIAAGIYKDYEEAAKRTVHITKTVLPRPEYKEVYQKKYQRYRKVIDALEKEGVWNWFKE